MLDLFPTRRTVRVSVVPVEMDWLVCYRATAKNQRNSKATAKATANCELQKQILRLRRRMTTKKQTNDDNKKANQ
jgi:hypothetical protein